MMSRFEKKRENENLAYFCNMMMSIHLCSEIVRVPRPLMAGMWCWSCFCVLSSC